MKVTSNGHRFDTAKAMFHCPLYYWDGSNRHVGDVYQSRAGHWYIEVPSQWSNQRRWMLMEPAEILDTYDRYLTEDDKADLATAAGLDWD